MYASSYRVILRNALLPFTSMVLKYSTERLLNTAEAARFLRVSQASIRRWSDSGLLAARRVGRRRERRFSESDLQAFMQQPATARAAADTSTVNVGGGRDHRVGGISRRGSHEPTDRDPDRRRDGIGARHVCLRRGDAPLRGGFRGDVSALPGCGDLPVRRAAV